MLSKSKIQTYKNCPYLYKLLYIDKREADYQTSYAKRGEDIHKLLYDFFDNYAVENGTLTPLFEIPYPYRKHFDNFLAFEQMRLNALKDKYPAILCRETEFTNSDLDIHGIVDRVDELPKVTIIEYKTGSPNPVELIKELHFYYLCVKPEFKAERVLAICLKDGLIVSSEIKQNIVEAVLKEIKFVREGIENELFDKKPSYNCRWCPFYDLCSNSE